MNLASAFRALETHGNQLLKLLTEDKDFINENGTRSLRGVIYPILENASSKSKVLFSNFEDNKNYPNIYLKKDDDTIKKYDLKTPYNGPNLKIARVILDDTNKIKELQMSKYFNIDSEIINKWDLANYNITEMKSGSYTSSNIIEHKINIPSDIPNDKIFYIPDSENETIPFTFHKESYINSDGDKVDMYLKIREG